MTAQTTIDFDAKKARELRDEGIMRSETKANADNPGWSEKALDFLKGYAEINGKFQMEDVRFASQGVVPTPKNQKAWGSIATKAAKLGWIYNVNNETAPVKNTKAHCANAKVWRSRILKYTSGER